MQKVGIPSKNILTTKTGERLKSSTTHYPDHFTIDIYAECKRNVYVLQSLLTLKVSSTTGRMSSDYMGVESYTALQSGMEAFRA